MALITLYCEAHPTLKLGPGRLDESESIVFERGFAFLDTEDPNFAEKLRWTTAIGTPLIENLGSNEEDRTSPSDPTAHTCPICKKAFRNEFSKKGHMRSHAPAPVG